MLKFEKEQKIFDIGGVEVGGQPGKTPTVLIGSLFHKGHKIVKDREKVNFDRERAESLIKMQEEMSEKTGAPSMLDIVGESEEELIEYIDFITEITDLPLLLNGPDASIRTAVAEHADEVGLEDKVVYNSINFKADEEEFRDIGKTGLSAAVVQAFNPKNPYPKGMLSILKGKPGEKGLLEKASDAGIDKPLILTPVFEVPTIGPAAKGIQLVKQQFGIPVGTAPIGTVGKWGGLGEVDGENARWACRGSAGTLPQAMGADYLIYGSAFKAKNMFPACAMTDAMIAQYMKREDVEVRSEDHPLKKMF